MGVVPVSIGSIRLKMPAMAAGVEPAPSHDLGVATVPAASTRPLGPDHSDLDHALSSRPRCRVGRAGSVWARAPKPY